MIVLFQEPSGNKMRKMIYDFDVHIKNNNEAFKGSFEPGRPQMRLMMFLQRLICMIGLTVWMT